MDLDLRLARRFVVLAEVGHFGRAAQRLHLTQSALTKQVQALERQVGSEVIDRSCRPWRLTAVGEDVLALSRDLCGRADRAARRADVGAAPVVTIGFQSSGSAGWPLAEILLANQEASGRMVRCRVLDITSYVSALTDGDVDLLVARPAPLRPGIVSLGVLAEPRALLVPRAWPEADARALSVEQASALPLAYNPEMSGGDNGLWALGDVRPLRDARVVPVSGRHFAEALPELLSGTAAMAVAPPADTLAPDSHARLVTLPDAPLVETAVCWRADDDRDDVKHLAAATAGALAAWARRQQRAAARWAPHPLAS